MHTINQSLAATILRLMRSHSWPTSFWRWELGATDFASIDILLGNARGQVDLPLHAKGFQRLEVAAIHILEDLANLRLRRISSTSLNAEGRMLVDRTDFGCCPQHWRPPGAPDRSCAAASGDRPGWLQL